MYKTIEDEWSPNNNFEDDKIDQFICHASLGLLFLRDTAVTTKMTHHCCTMGVIWSCFGCKVWGEIFMTS